MNFHKSLQFLKLPQFTSFMGILKMRIEFKIKYHNYL